MWEWIEQNKQWIFSGVGLLAVTFVIWLGNLIYRRLHPPGKAMLIENGCSHLANGDWTMFYVNIRNTGKLSATGGSAQLNIAPVNPFAITGKGKVTEASIAAGSTAAVDEVPIYWDHEGNPAQHQYRAGPSRPAG